MENTNGTMLLLFGIFMLLAPTKVAETIELYENRKDGFIAIAPAFLLAGAAMLFYFKPF